MTAIQGPSRTAAKAQSRSSSAADWSLTSWRSRPALQMPVYPDAAVLANAEARLRRVLTNDPAMGVFRHVDSGYGEAAACADEQKLDIPMRG